MPLAARYLMLAGALAIFATSANATGIPEGNPEEGERLFRRCAVCHVVDDSGKHRLGPNLYGVFGRTAGTAEGFRYSDAMKGSGIVWSEEVLFRYLKKPVAMVPKTRMMFGGLPDPQQRADLIAYLKAIAGVN